MMRLSKALMPLLAGALAVGCTDLEVTNPSQRTTETFFQNRNDALLAVNATYHALQDFGTFGRWQTFADDGRSDVALSRSPATELANFTKTVFASYDFGVNSDIWSHSYRLIFAANQVIANVPGIAGVSDADKKRFVAEAKFLRALMYYQLVTLYGGVPLLLEPSTVGQLPEKATAEAVYAQILQDAGAARTDLPVSYTGVDVGRATKGAAAGLIGKAQLQQRKWTEAAAAFAEVVAGPYSLLPNYGDNFRADRDNNAESVFEVQFTDLAALAQGSAGYSGPKLYGPCGPAFCDMNPTDWYFSQFFAENPAVPDPRLDFTIFYNKPGGMDVFGTPFATRYGGRPDFPNVKFIKKYTQYYSRTDEIFDNPINYKVMRLGGILLLQAEALNEAGRTAEAAAAVNRVRARVGLAALPAGLSQAAMRARIEREQLLELGFEAERFRYMQRQGLLTAANLPTLISHDDDFRVFVVGRSELLPIPNSETDVNPNVKQNPGY